MGDFTREEIEAAWSEFQLRGAVNEDWPAWADMFTDDAHYEEHNLGTFEGRAAIKSWIVDVMKSERERTL